MITSPFKPRVWMPGFNSVIWNFFSTKINEPNFSYVVDVFVQTTNGLPTTRSYRLFQRPSTNGNGMVDVADLVQSFYDLSPWTNGEGVTTQYSQFNVTAFYRSILAVYLKIGEQYEVNGVLTIFNGNSDVAGEPAFTAYAATGTNQLVRVVPSGLTYEEGVESLTSTATGGFYSPYIMDGNGQFLTYLPTNDIATGQTHTLSFLNWWDDAPGSFASGVQGLQVDYYGSTGGLISSTFYQNTTTNGGGPQTTDAYTTLAFSLSRAALSFRCGPADLTVPNNTSYYTVTAYHKSSATSSNTPGTVASESVRFDITEYCENLYPVVRLSWLNSLGGRDYYNFDMFYEKTTSSPSDSWYQNPINWTSITNPYSSDSFTSKTDRWLRGGKKTFNKTVTTRFTIQTDWILQETVDALAAIPESSSVWAYIGTTATEPVSIQITSIDYVYSNVKQQKLVQATMECEVTKTQSKQNM